MKRVIYLLILGFLVTMTTATLSAQNLSVEGENDKLVRLLSNDDSKIFFVDPESKVCFIDFDALNGYAKQLVVKNAADEVLIDEPLWELPKNTMYELDLEEFKQGTYSIELYTYSTSVRKEVEVR